MLKQASSVLRSIKILILLFLLINIILVILFVQNAGTFQDHRHATQTAQKIAYYGTQTASPKAPALTQNAANVFGTQQANEATNAAIAAEQTMIATARNSNNTATALARNIDNTATVSAFKAQQTDAASTAISRNTATAAAMQTAQVGATQTRGAELMALDATHVMQTATQESYQIIMTETQQAGANFAAGTQRANELTATAVVGQLTQMASNAAEESARTATAQWMIQQAFIYTQTAFAVIQTQEAEGKARQATQTAVSELATRNAIPTITPSVTITPSPTSTRTPTPTYTPSPTTTPFPRCETIRPTSLLQYPVPFAQVIAPIANSAATLELTGMLVDGSWLRVRNGTTEGWVPRADFAPGCSPDPIAVRTVENYQSYVPVFMETFHDIRNGWRSNSNIAPQIHNGLMSIRVESATLDPAPVSLPENFMVDLVLGIAPGDTGSRAGIYLNVGGSGWYSVSLGSGCVVYLEQHTPGGSPQNLIAPYQGECSMYKEGKPVAHWLQITKRNGEFAVMFDNTAIFSRVLAPTYTQGNLQLFVGGQVPSEVEFYQVFVWQVAQ